jgi:hypothetical protein
VSLVGAITDALRLSDRDTQTSAVHDVVRNALRGVAPGVEVRTTDYFTHTFIPDLLLAWGPDEQRQQRHVHLRFIVSDAAFLDEVDFLATTEPMFLGLLDTNPIAPGLDGSGAAERRAGTLVTQSAALDALEDGRTQDQRTVTATRELVRGGRGSIDRQRAAAIVDAYHDGLQAIEGLAEGAETAKDRTQLALGVLREVLRPRQFSTVERDLRSRWIRSGGDPFEFPGASEWDPRALTHQELGEVLNALLDSGRDLPADTWSRNAWFLSAQELAEALNTDRRGGALNQLATALLPNWTAQWVWAEPLDLPLQLTFDWLIAEKTLAVEIGDMRASFRDDGRRFKDKKRTDEPLRTISDMEGVLRDRNVQAASFRTASEEIAYSYRATAEQPLYDRLLQLFEPSQRDELRVTEVSTLVPGRDDIAEIDLDRQVIDLDKTPTPISVLIRLAFTYFHRAGYDFGDVEQFLHTGEPPKRPVDAPAPGEAASDAPRNET